MPTNDDLDAIRLAVAFYRHRGAREQAIVDRFGLTPVRFWQRVTGRLLHDPALEAALPVEVHALRRQLAAQMARRVA